VRNEQLIKLNQEKNNLIGIVAHDLKSPLSQIAGLLTLVKQTEKVDDEGASYLTMAEQSTKRLNEMIEKILDIDAIESKQLNLKMETLNFSQVVDSVATRFDAEANQKKISITRQIEPSLFITADQDYIEQVLENLLSNAIKFSPLDRKVFVSLHAANGQVVCQIKDNGPGLNTADLEKLFGKYQKLSARPTANEPSTGLGLSIAKKFMHAMQGDIWCESKHGDGASFFVAFRRVG
jgi:signal transduction histidine kinase